MCDRLCIRGKGSFSEVFVAEAEAKSDSKRVLKKYPGASKGLFDKEVQVLTTLKPHCDPYAICLDESWSDGESHYLTSKYYPDMCTLLEGTHDHQGFKNAQWVFGVITGLITGLRVLHGQARMALRDIKPENVLVSKPKLGILAKDVQVRYIDLGTSVSAAVPMPTDTCCSPLFIAPEMSDIKKLGQRPECHLKTLEMYQRADLWSLGMTIVELLDDSSPFDGWYHEVYTKTHKLAGAEISDDELLKALRTFLESYEFGSTQFDRKVERTLHQLHHPLLPSLTTLLARDPAKRTL